MKLLKNIAIAAAVLLAGCRVADDGNRADSNRTETAASPILTTEDAVDVSSFARPLVAWTGVARRPP